VVAARGGEVARERAHAPDRELTLRHLLPAPLAAAVEHERDGFDGVEGAGRVDDVEAGLGDLDHRVRVCGTVEEVAMAPGATRTQIDVTPTSAALGAVVTGVDLRAPSDDDVATVHAALLEHGVLFFRDQQLTDDEHLALARRFGEPSQFPIAKLFGATTPSLSYITDSSDSPPDADGWHTDITWIAAPPKLAFLQAIDIPARGGDTMWADLYAAYDALSPPMQQVCRSLRVQHVVHDRILDAFRARAGDELAAQARDAFPPVVHPLVRTHPETGRDALFVGGEFMCGIEGMRAEESRVLLDWLQRHIENPNFQVRWSWAPGDLAIWDERCTNHRALSDHFPAYRAMRRCTVDGDRPYLAS
jgi:taurine dioxygenase